MTHQGSRNQESATDQAERSERVQAYVETATKILESGIHAYGDQLALLVREAHSPDPNEVEEAIRQVRVSGKYGDGISAPLSAPAF